MTTFDVFLTYFGDVILALTFLYGLKNYWLPFTAGFVVFCVFYFEFAVKDFQWQFVPIANQLKDAAVIHIISCVIAVVIYKFLPVKETAEPAAQ